MRTAFAATPERFVRGVPTPPALPQAVWINKPRTMDQHDCAPVDLEPGERVARPTVWRSAPAGRPVEREVNATSDTNPMGLAAVH